MVFDNTIKQDIVEAGKRLYAKGFVASNDGNISARLDDEQILITPTGVCKGDLNTGDILTVDLDGNVISGRLKPTSEMKMHLAVYRKRKDVKAIVHAHPQNATAFAVAGQELNKISLPEVIFSLGRVSFSKYGTPSTNQVADEVEKVISCSDAVLLANHGALTVGTSVMDAYFKMETLDHFAAITIKARQLGGERVLNEQEEKELFRVRSEVFGKKGIYCTNCGACDSPSAVLNKVPDCVLRSANEIKSADDSKGSEVDELIEGIVEEVIRNIRGA